MDLPKDISTPALSEIHIGSYVGIITYVVEAIVVLVLLFNFFIPTYGEIRSLQEDIDIKQVELKDINEYAAYLKELANSTLAIEEDIINYALPSENDVVTLILTYEGLAASNENITISPISLSPGVLTQEADALEEGETGLQSVVFSMEVSSSEQEGVFSLIDQISRTRRIFDIDSISLTMPSENTEDVIMMDIGLSTYYFIESPITAGRALVKQGQGQTDFIAQLQNAIVYEDLILSSVELGKEDLFARDTAFTPVVTPTPASIEDDSVTVEEFTVAEDTTVTELTDEQTAALEAGI